LDHKVWRTIPPSNIVYSNWVLVVGLVPTIELKAFRTPQQLPNRDSYHVKKNLRNQSLSSMMQNLNHLKKIKKKKKNLIPQY
jgi:hypothetical protein